MRYLLGLGVSVMSTVGSFLGLGSGRHHRLNLEHYVSSVTTLSRVGFKDSWYIMELGGTSGKNIEIPPIGNAHNSGLIFI